MMVMIAHLTVTLWDTAKNNFRMDCCVQLCSEMVKIAAARIISLNTCRERASKLYIYRRRRLDALCFATLVYIIYYLLCKNKTKYFSKHPLELVDQS